MNMNELRFGLRYLSPEELPEAWRSETEKRPFIGVTPGDFAWLAPPAFSPSPSLGWRENYEAYLQSPAWRQKRAIAIALASNRCQRCELWFAGGRGLEVHHKTYEHLCNEPFEDLEVLCPDCHKEADRERELRTGGRRP